jgi:hypothetical protein
MSQSNGHTNEFTWNGKEYELIVDRSFWEQPLTIETFLNKISETYAREFMLSQSKKLGFQVIQSVTNLDNSNTFILERWN